MKVFRPLSLIAELTHRCPLRCVYCSNPLALKARDKELSTETWRRAFQEAGALGILQLHLTGGEPLARADLAELVAFARTCGLYTNLITSGIGLTEARLDELVRSGLDHVQLSFQDVESKSADEIAGSKAHANKLEVAQWIGQRSLAFTLNFVIHRGNLARLSEMIGLAEQLGAKRVELAHVQYYGWALKNRSRLLPTRVQVKESVRVVEEARKRLSGKVQIDFVVPDYYAKYPKPCMGGWGQKVMLMDPSGLVLPCHAAQVIPEVEFPVFPHFSLKAIWEKSELFQKFRGEEWMEEPCRSCSKRGEDFGGCRCQALLLSSNAQATDPVCTYSPNRALIDSLVEAAQSSPPAFSPEWAYRRF